MKNAVYTGKCLPEGMEDNKMAEYIDREEYCEKHCRCSNEYCDKESCPIWNAPSADVAPVVHGRWDDSGRYTFPSGSTAVRCTNCGCALTESEYHMYNWDYCPICGARMDGDEYH